jgi:hypothetical protein
MNSMMQARVRRNTRRASGTDFPARDFRQLDGEHLQRVLSTRRNAPATRVIQCCEPELRFRVRPAIQPKVPP